MSFYGMHIFQVVSDQLYIMCVKCCVAGKSVLDVIKLLFDNLHKTGDQVVLDCDRKLPVI